MVSFGSAKFSGGSVTFGSVGFFGGTVDFSTVTDWSQPPHFSFTGEPPAGVLLPATGSGEP
jgi:hypothetical protein